MATWWQWPLSPLFWPHLQPTLLKAEHRVHVRACTHRHITLHPTPASVLFEETPIALWSAAIDLSMLLLLLVVQKHGVYLRAAAAATLFAWPPCPM